ncbi:hypothetical protein UQW22_18590 [Isoptericola halotolerans]|uniref:hypothetical protein n=1 Tax=Isoptericola halotolerans TaxID=300560 RepID=UPI00388F9334
MNKLTRKVVGAQLALQAFAERTVRRAEDESGQGTVEYVGAVLLVVAIVGIVIAANEEVGEAIVTQLTDAVGDLSGAGG